MEPVDPITVSSDMIIRHVIPQVGVKELALYEPAKDFYKLLLRKREVRRLSALRHLGAYAFALQGARLARWDYTIAMIYYSNNFKLKGMNGNFRIGEIPFSSGIAALQAISLFWNIGHLPGTFAAEKGVSRYLIELDKKEPIYKLNWRYRDIADVKKIIKEANRLFLSDDYFSISRILGVFKLLTYVEDERDPLLKVIIQFVAPFFLEYDEPFSVQWHKLRSAFKIIRHLAYLTIDAPLSGIRWAPNIPTLFESLFCDLDTTAEEFEDKISEILSPFERATYESIYHRAESRKEAAILANAVYSKLKSERNGIRLLEEWIKASLKRHLDLPKVPGRSRLFLAASIKLRSHFSTTSESFLSLEDSLRKKKFKFPIVFEYKAWNSNIILEPNELVVDVISDAPKTQEVGRLATWLIKKFDNVDGEIDDSFEELRKESLLNAYKILLSRAIEIKFTNVNVKVVPWNFKRLGLFPDISSDRQISVWASQAKLSDPFTKHLTRRRRDLSPELRDEYQEILGIRALRQKLINIYRNKRNRDKYLVVAGSVTFCRDGRDLIEYDGGLLRISPKSGTLFWYGLESKRGNKNPERYLRKKLRILGVEGAINKLGSKHAYVEIKL